MKSLVSLLLFNALICISTAQTANLDNLCGYNYSTEEQSFLASRPLYQPSLAMQNRTLPTSVSNFNKPFFREEIFSQWHGSCAQAAAIGYCLTYELNRSRNLSGADVSNQYPTHFSFDLIARDALDKSSTFQQAYTVASELGIPSSSAWKSACAEVGLSYHPEVVIPGELNIYNDLAVNPPLFWLSGYERYLAGFNNRAKQICALPALNTPTGLTRLKRYLAFHGYNSNQPDQLTGGVAFFGMPLNNWSAEYTNDSPPIPILTHFTTDGGHHAMTIAGYNDDFYHDYNHNNIQEPEEFGALIIVNSWGMGGTCLSGNYFYLPYKLTPIPLIAGKWKLMPNRN